jgi:hypothetical protein
MIPWVSGAERRQGWDRAGEPRAGTEPAMTTEQLPKLINARPFRPFALRTADGREIEVAHPENIAYGAGRIAVVVVQDDVEIIDLLLVPSLKTTAGGGQ